MRNETTDRHQQSISFFLNNERKESLEISNHSRSPSRVVNGVKIYNFSDIDSYRRIHRPLLNEEKKNHIKEKLNLEKEVLNRVNKRSKNHQQMVYYRYNPFDKKAAVGHSKSEMKLEPEEEERIDIKKHDIVTGINNLKKKTLDNSKHSASLIKLKDNTERLSRFAQQNILEKKKSVQIIRRPSVSNIEKK